MLISNFDQIQKKHFSKQRKFVGSRVKEERAHFRQVFEKRKGLSWWVYATAAGKARLKRRGKIAAEYITPNTRVLELGSGLGEFTEELVKTGVDIVGLELTPELITKAKERIKNVVFKEGDAHHLPFKDNVFDFVVGNAILHHLDLQQALREIRRVLKDGGKIIFFEPNLANPHVFLQKKIGFFRQIFEESPRETAFFRWSIKMTLEKAGFINVKVTPFDFLYPLTPTSLVRLVRAFEPFLEKMPILKEFSGSLLIYGEVRKPTIAEIRKFWDQSPLYSKEIKEKPGTKEFFRKIDQIKKNEVDKYANHLYQFPAVRGKAILDAGCGPGFLVRAYASHEARVTAIDLSPVAVKLTRKSLKDFGFKGKVKVANIEKLPFPDQNFDQVVCHGVIHHTPNPGKAISEISRVTKKGGRAIIAVYFLNFWLKPFIFPLTRLGLKILGVKPVGRESLAIAPSASEFIRQYDGSQNPLTWALSRNEWIELITQYFEIERVETHFFPQRFVFGKRKFLSPLAKFLDCRFGTMLYFSLVKL